MSVTSPARRPRARLVRLREYLSTPRLPGAPLDEASSPAELFFLNNKTVWLETRTPGALWPRFDRDDANLAVVLFSRTPPPPPSSQSEASEAGAALTRASATRDSDVDDARVSSAAKEGSSDGVGGGIGGIPPPPPLPPALFPTLGKFTPDRNMRMQASGTVREVRAALAAFAGTDEGRTRVFTMRADSAESTYKVLCPPRRSSRRRRRHREEKNGDGGIVVGDADAYLALATPEQKEDGVRQGGEGVGSYGGGDGEGMKLGDCSLALPPKEEEGGASNTTSSSSSKPAATAESLSPVVVGFTTAKALAASEAAAGLLSATTASSGTVAGSSNKNEGDAAVDDGGGAAAGSGKLASPGEAGVAPQGSSAERSDSEDEYDGEDDIVVVGERGSTFLNKIYVEEVPEGEEEEEISPAVKTATDEPNRWVKKHIYICCKNDSRQ